jgi:serine/threonine protein kinase
MPPDPQFGAFRIVRRLGVGGMAETFVAERRGPAGFEQRVCLKRVLPAFCEDAAFVAMFQNEARLAARLTHPHIAQVYDFGEVEQQWWMALEFVDGVDLRALLDAVRALGQPLPLDLVLLVVADVCAALAYAHEPSLEGRPSLVHRDVSPSNVLLSYDGAVKLADFGIAKPASGDRATASGIKGKVPYMSPEQALGGAVDGRSDLFSLGVMAFEMLAGRRPFDGATDLATLSNLVAGVRPSLAALAPHAPAPLVALVERLIEPDRDARPASASDVLDALSSTSPPLSSRRVLGQLVRRVRPPESTAQPVDPMGPTVATPSPPPTPVAAPLAPAGTATLRDEPAPATPTQTPVAFTGPAAQPAPRRASRELIFAASSLALLVVLAASTAAIVLGGQTAERPSRSTTRVESTPPRATALLGRAPEPARDASTSPPADAPLDAGPPATPDAPTAAAARSTLVVTAYPWGLVEIDGRELGRSPVRLELSPGEHSVVVRADAVIKRRSITLLAGQRRELVVPLE